MSYFYKYPQTSFFGKVSKQYAKIETSEKNIISIYCTMNVFVPEHASETFSNSKEYRSYVEDKFFSNKIIVEELKKNLPEGYYIDPSYCFRWVDDGLESIRQFNKIYNGIRFSINVNVSNKILKETNNNPHLHQKAILQLFNIIDQMLVNVQTRSNYAMMFPPIKIGKITNMNKTVYLNNLAKDFKYLIKESLK